MADLVRQAVDRLIDETGRDDPRARMLAALGSVRSDTPDLAVNHDRYLYEDDADS